MIDTPMADELVPTFKAPAGQVLEVLRGARKRIVSGWSPFLCREAPATPPRHPRDVPQHFRGYEQRADREVYQVELGVICPASSPAARFFDLSGALERAAMDRALPVDAQLVAGDLVWRLLDHNLRALPDELAAALNLPGLLAVLDRAILRAHAVTRSRT
jgi:hypothetical protein